jgi:hypothetical protein
MPESQTPPSPVPRPSSLAPRRVSLIRCSACGRCVECDPAAVAMRVTAGPELCCGLPMELFVPAPWPGMGSGVIAAPRPRTLVL